VGSAPLSRSRHQRSGRADREHEDKRSDALPCPWFSSGHGNGEEGSPELSALMIADKGL